MPLVTVASCDGFGPGVFFVQGLGGGGYYSDPVVDVFVEETVILDDGYWDEDVYYEDDWYGDPYCDPYFYDCW
jgi:hypothetical protein